MNKNKPQFKFIKEINKIYNRLNTFEINTILTFFTSFVSFILIIALFIFIYTGDISFTYEQLNELANFYINVVFTLSALGFTIFSLPLSKHQNKKYKKKLLFDYIGELFLLVSIAIFIYIASFLSPIGDSHIYNFKYVTFYELCFCILLIMLSIHISFLLTIIIRYFKI